MILRDVEKLKLQGAHQFTLPLSTTSVEPIYSAVICSLGQWLVSMCFQDEGTLSPKWPKLVSVDVRMSHVAI